LADSVKEMYLSLMEIGFSQNQIDEMDLVYHMQLLAHRKESKGDKKVKSNKSVTIDQIIG